MTLTEIKSELLKKCADFVTFRKKKILKAIHHIENSLKEESKNTSGNKHHPNRAMLQINREQVGNQLKEIEKIQNQLNRINSGKASDVIKLGSLVYTDKAIFFLSISVGSLLINNTIYLGVAPNSPIGSLLLGKKKGEIINFNGTDYSIIGID